MIKHELGVWAGRHQVHSGSELRRKGQQVKAQTTLPQALNVAHNVRAHQPPGVFLILGKVADGHQPVSFWVGQVALQRLGDVLGFHVEPAHDSGNLGMRSCNCQKLRGLLHDGNGLNDDRVVDGGGL